MKNLRRLLECLLPLGLLVSATVLAQTAEQAPSLDRLSPRRAPLADAADLEPAANVGDITQKTQQPVAAPATTPAAPNAPAAPAAPASPPTPTTARVATSSGVMDTLDLGTTSITGNQELPKVLYIVPWKKSDLGDLVGRPVNTLLDEVLAPVDPDVFERHLEYYETLYGTGQQE